YEALREEIGFVSPNSFRVRFFSKRLYLYKDFHTFLYTDAVFLFAQISKFVSPLQYYSALYEAVDRVHWVAGIKSPLE
ncbi:hypothetical protein C7B76_23290, partial [filamentous cyanobacterium CCP2]